MPFPDQKFQSVFSKCILFLIGLHALFIYVIPNIIPESFAFVNRQWGFHFWTLLPTETAISAYCIALLALFPQFHQKLFEKIAHIEKPWAKLRHHPTWAWGIIVLCSWVIFWILKQKYGLLGDGYLRAQDLDVRQIPREEIGILLLQIGLHRFLSYWNPDPVFTMQIFSVFWGGFYVVLSSLCAQRLAHHWIEKIVITTVLLSVGIIQYFFGYIEVYAPMPVFFLAFFILGHGALKNHCSPIWMTVVFLLGIFMHVMMAAVCLAVVFIWYRHIVLRHPHLKKIMRITCAGGLLLGLIGYIVFSHHLHVRWLPIWATESQPYAILTSAHLWEWINAQILGGPLSWPLLIFGLWWVFSQHKRFDPLHTFLALCWIGYLFGSLTLNFVLGSRDWDLMSFAGLPLTLFAIALLTQGQGPIIKTQTRFYMLNCAAIFYLLNTGPWIWINHTDTSLTMIERMLDHDPAEYYQKHPPELVLGMMYSKISPTKAYQAFEKGHQQYQSDKRFAYNMAVIHFQNEQFDQAIKYATDVTESMTNASPNTILLLALSHFQLDNDHKTLFYLQQYTQMADETEQTLEIKIEILNRLGYQALQQNQHKQAIDYFEQSLELDATQTSVYINLGSLYLQTNLPNKAEKVWLEGQRTAPQNTHFLYNLAQLYALKKQFKQAIDAYQNVLKINPHDVEVYLELSKIYLTQGREKQALDILTKGLEQIPSNEKLHQAQKALASKNN